jgi:capsular exopolysaccharide synthesis family protein
MTQTQFDGLILVPSGPQPPNPSEMLASERMRRRLAQFRQLADIVVIDTSPVLAVSDPAILAALADGAVLVVNAARTRGHHAAQAAQTLQSAGARLLGVVLNRTPMERRAYYAYDSEAARVATGAG